ncbi:hypothetical protein GX50_04802 [[Emmonsia] crescens]|uniref:Uncharacterized protein n=1 Tax=[Emmonsia] crescens TaxID=73230 RepID=A0A2B7ZI08_9EURO|nr:hypothetical protein GX50_04802 [Emmonsia crescens]
MIVCLDLQQDGDKQSDSIEADDTLIDGSMSPPKQFDSLDYTPPQTISPDPKSGAGSGTATYTPEAKLRLPTIPHPHHTLQSLQSSSRFLIFQTHWESLFQEYGFEDPNLGYLPDFDPFMANGF